jgi:hypothetical protein
MKWRDRSWRKFSNGVIIAAAAGFLLGCSEPAQLVPMRKTFAVGQFRLQVVSVNVEDRRHNGLQLDVEIRLSYEGRNRFDRLDFADALNKEGRPYLRARGGWRERIYLATRRDDTSELVGHGYPPFSSQGYVMGLRNPYGKRELIEVDLGR